jgi:hypothetical protein
VRRLVFAVLVLTACRRSHPTVEAVAPPAPAPTVAAPAPAAPEQPAATPAASPEAVADERSQPPSEPEIRVQLEPLLPSLKSCLRAQGKLDAAVRLELHVWVEPAGEVSDALIVGLPGAHDCARDAMTKLRLPRWRGAPSLISITLSTTGDPVLSAPPDGGR